MSKIQIQKFIENDELDLSLQNLTEIPAKEISKYSKIKSLDLSCNGLENVTSNIGLLTNIVKLDLSKNKIQSLPEDIGKLVNLEYLDLRSNKLTDLPLSLGNLKKLKWLDLKDNPLNPNLKKAAGDCLDKAKCEKCAIDVLELVKQSMSKSIKKNQKKKRREEELRRQKAQEEEKLREQRKLEKTELRSKRKLEIEVERQRQLSQDGSEKKPNHAEPSVVDDNISQLRSNRFINVFYQLLFATVFLFGLTTVAMFFLVLCNQNSSKLSDNVAVWCRRIDQNLPNSLLLLRDWIQRNVAGYLM